MKYAVVGGGLTGRLISWQLLQQGHQVELFDKDHKQGAISAARVAAAMLAPLSESVRCEPLVYQLGISSLPLWQVLVQQLCDQTGQAILLQQRGSIVVAHPADNSELQRFSQQLQQQKHIDHQSISQLNQQQLKQLEPELAQHFQHGILLNNEGCLHNWQLLDALVIAIAQLGGIWHEATAVEAVSPYSIKVNQQQISFDGVIDCRGFGAKADLSGLRGVRGEVLWVYSDEVNLTRPIRLMHPRYQLYVAPKGDGLFVIGATEIESESMAPITVRSSLELMSALYSLHSGFAEATVVQSYANCRPAFMDNLPQIQHQPGLTSINGLYRHGFLIAPQIIQDSLNCLNNTAMDFPELLRSDRCAKAERQA